MSGHRRKQIRKAVVDYLKDREITGVGDSVFGNRVRRLWGEHLPCILVYTRTESSEPLNLSNRDTRRTLRLAIEARASVSADLDDVLDDLADAIENAIDENDDLGLDFVSRNILSETEIALEDADRSAMPIGGIRLTYDLDYLKAGSSGAGG